MRIGQVAAASGATTKTLRFYEEAGLLPPPRRTAAGYRDYAPDVLNRLDFIRRGRAAGLTLAQVRDVLGVRDAGSAPCGHVHRLLEGRRDELDRQIADLQALRDTVSDLLARAGDADPADCDAAAVCRFV